MARPRRDDQETLIQRIGEALQQRQSLEPWTLAEIAPAAGLSPAGLIKRFGSRKGILVALSHRWIESIPDGPGPAERPTREELRAWVEQRFSPVGADAVASALVNLLDDLTDPELRALLAQGWDKEIRYLAALLEQMPLPRLFDATRGARLLFDCLNGAMLRHATRVPTHSAVQLLDDLLEAWS